MDLDAFVLCRFFFIWYASFVKRLNYTVEVVGVRSLYREAVEKDIICLDGAQKGEFYAALSFGIKY